MPWIQSLWKIVFSSLPECSSGKHFTRNLFFTIVLYCPFSSMRPEKVSSWRERLPAPFDKSSQPLKRCGSVAQLVASVDSDHEKAALIRPKCHRRRSSAPYAVDQVNRSVECLRSVYDQHTRNRKQRSALAIEKLRRHVSIAFVSLWLTLRL